MSKTIRFFLAVWLLAAVPGYAQAGAQKIGQWLVLGPAEVLAGGVALPAGDEAALAYDFLDPAAVRPRAGDAVRWSPDRELKWQEADPRFAASGAMQVCYLAVYLESRRWLQSELVLESGMPWRVYLDGLLLPQSAQGAKTAGKNPIQLNLASGKHLLLLKGILPAATGPEKGNAAFLRASLENKPAFRSDPVSVSLTPDRRSNLQDVLHTVNINDVFMAPDGRKVAVSLSQRRDLAGANESWLEILDTENGSRIYTSRGSGAVENFQWLKNSRSFSSSREEKGQSELRVYDLDSHSSRMILSGIRNFASCWWSADNSFLVYAVTEEAEKSKVFRHVKKLDDRARSPERRRALTLYYPDSGVRQPLAGFDDDFSQVAISPDGRSLLLASSREDTSERPYRRFTLILYSLADGRRERLVYDPWIHDFSWSPDGKKLLLLGGPSAFAGLGSTLPPAVVPNDYDIQAYLFDVKTRKASALTRQFAPAVGSAFWHPGGGIFMKVTDNDYTRLYRCAPGERKFSRLDTAVDAVESVGFSMGGLAAYSGSGLGAPQKLFLLHLASGNSRVLKDYNRGHFAGVRFGKVENWNFKTAEGRTIGGYICYPPDFDPARLYPCIVNYYGGTTPVGRNFGGRYPKDWYAANGYIVCVLQPSGAIGYGQEFSSAHVNDWGEITSAEIIRGVEELLRSHVFIDRRRVGAIGASYGGFMTQVLASKTDLFAGLISHAGISALSSYWGAGDWGYSYSGVASAESFPWNRKDIYVGHSPLFMAERIRQPLLLLHGEDDNNVPPGESYQMFAALKLLKKEVALVTFPGQQHFILAPEQRVRWLHTIMAWFDRWLKGQGEWWKDLYPE
jgi:dipeptidyl aminopeptidase/acylaminoacyl peptidase